MKMGIEEGEDHDVQNILEFCVSYLDQAVEIMKRFSFNEYMYTGIHIKIITSYLRIL